MALIFICEIGFWQHSQKWGPKIPRCPQDPQGSGRSEVLLRYYCLCQCVDFVLTVKSQWWVKVLALSMIQDRGTKLLAVNILHYRTVSAKRGSQFHFRSAEAVKLLLLNPGTWVHNFLILSMIKEKILIKHFCCTTQSDSYLEKDLCDYLSCKLWRLLFSCTTIFTCKNN